MTDSIINNLPVALSSFYYRQYYNQRTKNNGSNSRSSTICTNASCPTRAKFNHDCTYNLQTMINRLQKNDVTLKQLNLDTACIQYDEEDNTCCCYDDFLYCIHLLCESFRNTKCIIDTIYIDSNFLSCFQTNHNNANGGGSGSDHDNNNNNNNKNPLQYELFRSIGKLSNLKHLDLFCNRKEFPVIYLTKALSNRNKSLLSFGLYNANLVGTDVDFEDFISTLKLCSNLVKVTLFQVRFHYSAKSGLGPIMKSLSYLTKLEDLKVIHIGKEDPNIIDDISFHLLCTLKTMKQLYLNGIQLNKSKISLLGQVLSLRYAQLKLLNLSCCDIGDVGCCIISNALLTNTNLAELNLANNKLGIESAISIRNFLRVNSSIKLLNLSNNNQLGNQGCTIICNSILPHRKTNNKSNNSNNNSNQFQNHRHNVQYYRQHQVSQLQQLHLSHCSISEQGYQSIIQMIQHNRTLHTLYIKFNDAISNELSLQLLHAVQYNTIIQDIIMDPIPIPILNKIRFYLDCNSHGRHRIMGKSENHITKEQYVNSLIDISGDLNKLYYWIQTKPQFLL